MRIDIRYFFRKRVAAFLKIKRHTLKLSEPLVSFTFDDVPDSGYLNGTKILNNYGYKGTYYISLGIKDKNSPSDLKNIVINGGELACHTYNHIRLSKHSKSYIVADIAQNQKAMDAIIPGYRFKNFSYPAGEVILTAKEYISERFRSGRSVNQGLNLRTIDLNSLKVIQLKQGNNLKNVKSEINSCIRKKGWIIFCLHDVQENPSSYGCTQAYFDDVVKYCKERKLKVLTIDQALNYLESKH